MNANADRAKRFLVYGFAISVVVHLVLLPFARTMPTVSAREPDPDVVYRTRIPTPPPTPRPTPTPAPTIRPTAPPHQPQRTPAPQRRVRIVTLRTDTHHSGGPVEPPNTHTDGDRRGDVGANGTETAAPSVATALPMTPTPTPTPHPTPTPRSCARPNVPATTVHALEPDTPALAEQQGISGTVEVVVSLDAQSRIVATRIQHSPSAVLNAAALAAARGSQFRTEIQNCEPIAADYLFSVDFTSQ